MFLDNKYTATYLRIVIRALKENRKKVKGGTYYESHHIFPKAKSCWPEYKDAEWNRVLLTAKEHLICHLLLTKMFEKGKRRHAMTYAFRQMTRPAKTHKRNITIGLKLLADELASKGKRGPEYAYLAKNFGNMSGSKNGMFGRNHSEESITKMKAAKANISDKTRELVGNHRRGKTYEEMYGAEKAAEIRQKFRATTGKRVTIDGVTYPSIGDAMRTLNMSYPKVKKLSLFTHR